MNKKFWKDMAVFSLKLCGLFMPLWWSCVLWATWWEAYKSEEKTVVVSINSHAEAGFEKWFFFISIPMVTIGVVLLFKDAILPYLKHSVKKVDVIRNQTRQWWLEK